VYYALPTSLGLTLLEYMRAFQTLRSLAQKVPQRWYLLCNLYINFIVLNTDIPASQDGVLLRNGDLSYVGCK